MKFVYGYKTSDGVRHEGVYSAASREAVYEELKAKGIKPFGVTLAPGLFNRIRSFGYRRAAILVLALVSTGAIILAVRRDDPRNVSRYERSIMSETRRQPIGDTIEIEQGLRTGWSDVFPEKGDQFLASFAVPGRKAAVRTVTVGELEAALQHDVSVGENDGIEVRQIKAMVSGMKKELREFISAGGSFELYGRRLVERQEAEIGYYGRVRNELLTAAKSGMSDGDLAKLWSVRNRELSGMGIRAVPMPE